MHSLSDFAVTRMLARVPTPYDRQDALDWLVPRASGVSNDWALAITEGDDVHIGVVGIELRHGRWHLGYWLNRYYWRRGIMGEAVAASLERFGRRMGDTAVFSGVFADNPASLKLQQKLGFSITGCAEIYSFARNTMVAHIETVLKPGALRLGQPR
jgi:RimJ/RimL family protein N-acetyltransferase